MKRYLSALAVTSLLVGCTIEDPNEETSDENGSGGSSSASDSGGSAGDGAGGSGNGGSGGGATDSGMAGAMGEGGEGPTADGGSGGSSDASSTGGSGGSGMTTGNGSGGSGASSSTGGMSGTGGMGGSGGNSTSSSTGGTGGASTTGSTTGSSIGGTTGGGGSGGGVSCLTQTGATTVWHEDFEGEATGWNITGGVWAVGAPTASDGPSAFGGNAVAGTILGGDYESSHNAYLVSPTIAVPAANQNPRFSFYYWYELAAGDNSYFYYRVDGGAWQPLTTLNQSGDGDWRKMVVRLDDIADRNVEFGFRLTTNTAGFAPGVYIDDARFETGPMQLDCDNGFEAGFGDWSSTGVWAAGAPTASDGPGAYDGTQVAGTILSGDYGNSHNAYLISPTIAVPSANELPRLSFKYWYELSTGDNAYMLVRVDQGAWQPLATINQSGDGAWREMVLQLGAYADRTVQVALRLTTNTAAYGPGVYIDDFRVETGAVQVDTEGFENGFNGWSAYGGVWAAGEPTATDGPAPHGGNAVMGTILSGDYQNSHNAYLVSPKFFVPEDSTDPSLSYWYWYEFAAGDSGYVLLRVDDGSWQSLETITQSGDDTWRQRVIDLSAYRDRYVEVAFRMVSNTAAYAPGWYIDDVSFNLD